MVGFICFWDCWSINLGSIWAFLATLLLLIILIGVARSTIEQLKGK